MKKLLFVLCALPVLAFAKRVHPYLKTARDLGWSDEDVGRLETVITVVASNRVMAARNRGMKLAAERAAPKTDPDLERLRRDARKRAARYAVLKRTVTRHEPGKTNLVARAMAATLAEKIEAARSLAASWETAARENEADAKVTKDIRKAAKKAEKNLEKILKDLEKAKGKSSTTEEAGLYQALIDILSPSET